MNEEILENLLIDRALGQLTPEVTALLDAYLAQNPDAARAASELDDTVSLAGTVLQAGAPSVKPPERLVVSPRSVVPFRPVLAMAASFAVGVGLTILLQQEFRTSRPSSSVSHAVVQSTSSASSNTVKRTTSDPGIRNLPFWSKERAYLLTQNSGGAKH